MERLNYIDVIKGVLILIVIIHHIPDVSRDLSLSDSVSWLGSAQLLYVGFFMTAFFIISGMVSNFNKPFCAFCIASFKGLMIPSFFVGFIFNLSYLHYNGSHFDLCEYLKHFIYNGGAWFCAAMFISRIIYWRLVNFHIETRSRIICLFILSIIGALAYSYNIIEIWSLWHALSLTVFLEVGAQMKKLTITRKMAIFCSIMYICLVIISYILGYKIPRISMSFMYNVFQIIPGIIFSILATIPIIYMAKYITQNGYIASSKLYLLLVYIGKGSLLIYLSHAFFLRLCVMFINEYKYLFGNLTIIVPLISFAFTVGCCCFTIYLFNRKYVRCILGKF